MEAVALAVRLGVTVELGTIDTVLETVIVAGGVCEELGVGIAVVVELGTRDSVLVTVAEGV